MSRTASDQPVNSQTRVELIMKHSRSRVCVHNARNACPVCEIFGLKSRLVVRFPSAQNWKFYFLLLGIYILSVGIYFPSEGVVNIDLGIDICYKADRLYFKDMQLKNAK